MENYFWRELTLVTLFFSDLLGNVLDLEQKLDTLDRGDSGLGYRGRHATSDEILQEGDGIGEVFPTHFRFYWVDQNSRCTGQDSRPRRGRAGARTERIEGGGGTCAERAPKILPAFLLSRSTVFSNTLFLSILLKFMLLFYFLILLIAF